ncbi:uncharacterized protein LOC129763491 isoform X2 [Toxorhynchites rutilus septentrionalis]|uniref:uncharacterized protein LOC129763491 isoform X2 n=1 Tax=Toxorhynchites rutilus septentrionalis TaxID=329112 RepID=UPI0024784A93|nr:uncharacterized protein LOC129763491 isoform X2 [Toxorhynchites rutilus septentrionalis]
MFSPIESIRKEVMLQITNSLTQLQLGQPGPSIVPRVSQETQTDDTEANSGGNQESRQSKVQSSQPRRQLRSSLNHSHPSILLNGPQSSVVPSGSDILRQPKEYLLNRVDLESRPGVPSRPASSQEEFQEILRRGQVQCQACTLLYPVYS